VVTTPLTFAATASTAILQGADVVFADIDEATGNLSLEAAAAAVNSRTTAITAVDYAGLPVDQAGFRRLAESVGGYFIEDAAHSIGSTVDGIPVGSTAHITTFSFFPTKNLTTAEGGAVVTTSAELDRRARSFRNHGLVRDKAAQRWPDEGPWHQEVHELGLNYRLPDVLAALGTSQLRRLASFKTRRASIVARYNEAFAPVDDLTVPVAGEGSDPIWHLYPLRVPAERRRAIFERLRADGIGVQVNYIPVYWHPAFADLGYRRGLCPVAERYYASEISLPLYVDLTDSEVDRVIEAVLAAVRA
jgi:dTDP-4-amino-4,6-dideoxygalactose transaminase